jgi:hypothetical protein
MDTIIEYRKSRRLAHKATIMIEAHDTGAFQYATTQNLSGDGIYCGSDYAIKPGTFITLRIDNLPYRSSPKLYLGKVLRCEELEDENDSHNYGLGIKIIKAVYV